MRNENTGYYGEIRPIVQTYGKNVQTIFRDTRTKISDTECFTQRNMVVDGKAFHVKSIFPIAPSSTPSKELMALIGSEK